LNRAGGSHEQEGIAPPLHIPPESDALQLFDLNRAVL